MTNHAELIAALRIPMNATLPGAPELDEYDEQRKAAADRIEELEAKLASAERAMSLMQRTDDLREAYHQLPNDKNRIGDKRSKKSHARDAWLRSFRKAAKEARAVLAEINGGGDT